MTSRARIYALLNSDRNDRTRTAWWVEIGLIILITLNVLAVLLETEPDLYARHQFWFDNFDLISVVIFTIEYFARVWSSIEDPRYNDGWRGRLRYMVSPMAIIDFLAIAPFYFTLFFSADLRILRVLRLLRVFKLTRYSSAMTTLLDVFREEASTLFAGFFILFILLIISASGAYLVEHQAQPEAFRSIPAAMWWALVTLTTVGYGDVTPITPLGRIFGGLVTIIGVGMAALPAGILASGLTDHIHRKRDNLKRMFRAALEDGVIDIREEAELETLRRELGISRTIALQIREDIEIDMQIMEQRNNAR